MDDTKNPDDESHDMTNYPNAVHDGSSEILKWSLFEVILWALAVGRTDVDLNNDMKNPDDENVDISVIPTLPKMVSIRSLIDPGSKLFYMSWP